MIVTQGLGGFSFLSIPPTVTYSVDSDKNHIMLLGQEKRLQVQFLDTSSLPYDPVSVGITIYNPNSLEVLVEAYSVTSPNIKKYSTGVYYIDITSSLYGTTIGDYQLVWNWRDTSSNPQYSGFQSVFVVPIQVFSIFPYLRGQMDKGQKDMDTVYGYNDAQLYMYIKGGLSEINRVPPNTNYTLINYPYSIYQQLLIDIATYVGLTSQTLLSIDSDANYSLQGNSFTVDHFAKLSSFLASMRDRMNMSLKQFKFLQLERLGAVKVERGVSYRQGILWSASPSGISFSNVMGVR